MAYTTGTATNYSDLLDKLRAYLVSQGWTTLSYTAGTVSGGGGSLFTRGPGAGSDKRVFIEIRTLSNLSSAFYGWSIRGATGYVSGLPEGGNPGVQPTAGFINLWQNSIPYWIFANDRRFILVAKVSSSYMPLYGGFFLPWSIPDGYPFPLFTGATYSELNSYSLSNAAHRFFTDPGGSVSVGGSWVRSPSGVWYPVFNHTSGGTTDSGTNLGRVAAGYMWPQGCGENDLSSTYLDLGTPSSGATSATGMWDNMVPTRQNEYGLFPTQIHMAIDVPPGTLDGVYHIGGSGIATEQQITIGARTFRLFQNINRSSGNDFMAIEEI